MKTKTIFTAALIGALVMTNTYAQAGDPPYKFVEDVIVELK